MYNGLVCMNNIIYTKHFVTNTILFEFGATSDSLD